MPCKVSRLKLTRELLLEIVVQRSQLATDARKEDFETLQARNASVAAPSSPVIPCPFKEARQPDRPTARSPDCPTVIKITHSLSCRPLKQTQDRCVSWQGGF